MAGPELRLIFTPDGAASVEAAVVRTERAAEKAAEAVRRSSDESVKAAKRAEEASRKAEAASDAMAGRVAGGARQASFALETMARQGQVAGEPLRQLLSIGAEMAFMFGPAGIVAGAVASLGLAFVGTFTRARDEMERTRETFRTQIAGIIDDGDVAGIQQRAAKLWRGVFDVDQGRWRDGVGQLMAERNRIATDPNQLFRSAVLERFDAREVEINGERRAVKDLIAEYEKLTALLRNPPPLPRQLTGMAAVTVTAGGTGSGPPKSAMGPAVGGWGDNMLRFWESQLSTKGEDAESVIGRMLPANKLRDTVAISADVDVGAVLANIKDATDKLRASLEEEAKRLAEGARRVGAVITGGIADGIATAVRTLDLGAGFKQMTAGILAGIGGMMIETGQAMVTFGALIEAFKKSLLSFFGGNAVLAGLALIASGAVLQGLSGRLGNIGPRVATGGDRAVGGGLGIPGTASVPVTLPRQPWERQAAGLGTPEPQRPLVFAGNVFGPKDPALPRYLFDAMAEGAARGFKLPAYAIEAG